MKLEAKLRLRAWFLNNLTETRSWKKWVDLELFPDPQDLLNGVFGVRVGSLNGYVIYKAPSRNSYYLVDEFAVQLVLVFGYMPMTKVLTEDLIAVNPKYQGQGLAYFFYEWLLREHGEIHSDISLSTGAAKLWMRLLNHHHGYLLVKVGSRQLKVDIHGFELYKGTWWPQIERQGVLTIFPKIDPTDAERQALRQCRYVLMR